MAISFLKKFNKILDHQISVAIFQFTNVSYDSSLQDIIRLHYYAARGLSLKSFISHRLLNRVQYFAHSEDTCKKNKTKKVMRKKNKDFDHATNDPRRCKMGLVARISYVTNSRVAAHEWKNIILPKTAYP